MRKTIEIKGKGTHLPDVHFEQKQFETIQYKN